MSDFVKKNLIIPSDLELLLFKVLTLDSERLKISHIQVKISKGDTETILLSDLG